MKVTLTPIEAFKITAEGTDLGEFKTIDTWRGLTALRREDGQELIVTSPSGYASMFKTLLDQPYEGVIFTASPSLLAILTELKSKKAEPTS